MPYNLNLALNIFIALLRVLLSEIANDGIGSVFGGCCRCFVIFFFFIVLRLWLAYTLSSLIILAQIFAFFTAAYTAALGSS